MTKNIGQLKQFWIINKFLEISEISPFQVLRVFPKIWKPQQLGVVIKTETLINGIELKLTQVQTPEFQQKRQKQTRVKTTFSIQPLS